MRGFLADARFTIPARIRPEIIRRHLAGESQVQIAADFKVEPSTICRIIARYERDQQAAREAAMAVAGAAKLGELGIVVGDYRKAGSCIADGSVELIFTDPPLERRHINQFADLGRFAARVLKPGASLIAYVPDYDLPRVLSLVLRSSELRFWWSLAVQHTGPTRILDKFGINVWHKTLLWFVKGGQRARRAQVDSLIVSRPDKRYHGAIATSTNGMSSRAKRNITSPRFQLMQPSMLHETLLGCHRDGATGMDLCGPTFLIPRPRTIRIGGGRTAKGSDWHGGSSSPAVNTLGNCC